jgi:hypothetical protein
MHPSTVISTSFLLRLAASSHGTSTVVAPSIRTTRAPSRRIGVKLVFLMRRLRSCAPVPSRYTSGQVNCACTVPIHRQTKGTKLSTPGVDDEMDRRVIAPSHLPPNGTGRCGTVLRCVRSWRSYANLQRPYALRIYVYP